MLLGERTRSVWFFAFAVVHALAFFAARSVWFFAFALAFAFCLRGAGGLVCLCLRWHPRYAFVLHASPLCGAAPTFLCRRKEK